MYSSKRGGISFKDYSVTAVFAVFILVVFLFNTLPSWAGINYQHRADELLPVDCLLPGVVRKLGSRMTYLTPRRAVKTTGVNCEIRGGEYVLYDRSDYKSALAIWLPMATSGDARAQNYVGEIYEKGLGVEPNYKQAAHWYEQSALQDYSSAQVNIGQLYERGVGVNRNMDKAIDWYRKAAGITGKQMKFISYDHAEEQVLAMGKKISNQSIELRQAQLEIQKLAEALDKSNSGKKYLIEQLQSSAQRVAHDKKKLNDFKLLLRQREMELEKKQAELQGSSDDSLFASDLKELEQRALALKEKEEHLKDREKTLNLALSVKEKRNRELAEGQESLEKDRQRVSQEKADVERLRIKLEQLKEKNEKIMLGSMKYKNQEKASKSSILALQSEVLAMRKEVAEKEEKLSNRENRLLEKNAQVESTSHALVAMSKQLEGYKKQVADLQSTKADHIKNIEGLSINMIEPQLVATRSGDFFVRTRGNVDQKTIIGRVVGPAGVLNLVVNDRDVGVDDRGLFQESVPLHGENTRVSIVAIDAVGNRSNLNFMLGKELDDKGGSKSEIGGVGNSVLKKRPIPKLNFGNYHALVVGNKDYANLPDLDTTIDDVNALARILSEKYGFQVKVLTNATRYDLLSELELLRQTLTEEDNLLIYYAGHGELDEVNNRGHWLPVDAEETSRANWISNVAVSDILNSMSAQKVLVIADSCYSGSMTRSTLARLDAGRSDKAWKAWLRSQIKNHSRLVFSSGGLTPVLDGGGGKHSIFAKALFDVLNSNNSVVEGREIHSQVAQAVNYAAQAAQFEQTPMYAPIKFAGHEGGDFLFVPK